MKQDSARTVLFLTLPCVFILIAGAGVARWREAERKFWTAYYSQPFKPRLELARGKVPGYSLPGLFEVQARTISSGGRGQSHWLIRGELVTVGRKSSREIWNAQKFSDPSVVSHNMRGTYSISGGSTAANISGPSGEATFSWRFVRLNKEADNLKFIVEAVAIPTYVPEDELGSTGINVKEATPAQIAAGKQQAGAKYFRESIELKARDDSKHHFSRDAIKQ